VKNKLSEYVRLAAAGETVVVTDRGRAVAEIVPPRRESESIIERGVREGWLKPAKRPSTVAAAQAGPRLHVRACWPIWTAIEKIVGDLHRQFGSPRRLAR